jgi:hypothetical protein
LLINGKWPPKTLAELIDWQKQLDPTAARKIIKRILRLIQCKLEIVIVLFASPTTQYAAGIILGSNIYDGQYKKHGQRRLKTILSSEVRVLSIFRLDDHYIVERNQPGRTSLIDKKLILIGCGTIGGFLADLLVKSGAGLGAGEFVLVDTDSISPGNVGRHKLGVNNIFENKAKALAIELKRAMPTANIEGIALNGKEINLQDFDLIINATGEQAFSDELSLKINKGAFTPILHCWIEGPGTAVRSFLQDAHEKACYRCLSDANRKAIYLATTVPYPEQMAGHGCESLYVPFAATASVYAAALAAEHVMDWVNQQPEPRFRTLVIDRNYQSEHLQVNPDKQLGCPACAT